MRRALRDYLPRWLAPTAATDHGTRLYAAAMERSRDPTFFADLGVPDTLDGRFDSLALHVVLLVRRLVGEPTGKAVVQALYDAMFDDMDRSLREMGVGDLGVGRRVRQMGEALMGRMAAYGAALDGSDEETLNAVIARNLYGTLDQSRNPHLTTVARYLRRAEAALFAQDWRELLDRGPRFPAILDIEQR